MILGDMTNAELIAARDREGLCLACGQPGQVDRDGKRAAYCRPCDLRGQSLLRLLLQILLPR